MTTSRFESMKEKWWKFHKENPHVYEMFERFALELIRRGVKHTSHWLLLNRMRWQTAIDTRGDEFKIRNDFIAYYARLFIAYHPEHEGFFTLKKLKEDEEPYL